MSTKEGVWKFPWTLNATFCYITGKVQARITCGSSWPYNKPNEEEQQIVCFELVSLKVSVMWLYIDNSVAQGVEGLLEYFKTPSRNIQNDSLIMYLSVVNHVNILSLLGFKCLLF